MTDHRAERELLGAWALDAVDDVERAAVERAIREDPEVAAEARALRETVARIAEADAVAPPPSLRGEVLTTVTTTPQDGGAVATPSPGSGDDAREDPGHLSGDEGVRVVGRGAGRGRRVRHPQRW
ncbi:hypothetical protein GB881_17450, partial [Georgenia subflava]|nr:hypothetical protein [Georgenia subflava]